MHIGTLNQIFLKFMFTNVSITNVTCTKLVFYKCMTLLVDNTEIILLKVYKGGIIIISYTYMKTGTAAKASHR